MYLGFRSLWCKWFVSFNQSGSLMRQGAHLHSEVLSKSQSKQQPAHVLVIVQGYTIL